MSWHLAEISICRAEILIYRALPLVQKLRSKSRATLINPLPWMAAERPPVCSSTPSAYLFLGIRELDEQPLSEVPARESQANNVLERQPLELSASMMAMERNNATSSWQHPRPHRSGRPVHPPSSALSPSAKQLACIDELLNQ